MNREMRRHPIHPALPILPVSKNRILDKKRKSKSSDVKLNIRQHRRKG